MHSSPAPRRSFHFSLRTLFILLTIVGVWIGWQVSIVRPRRELRQEIEAKGEEVIEANGVEEFQALGEDLTLKVQSPARRFVLLTEQGGKARCVTQVQDPETGEWVARQPVPTENQPN